MPEVMGETAQSLAKRETVSIMPLELLRRIPLGCYFGFAIITLGFVALDIRGIFVGVVVAWVAAISPRYQRPTSMPVEVNDRVRIGRQRRPLRVRLSDWFGTPSAVARTVFWLFWAGLTLAVLAALTQLLILVLTDSL